MGDDEGYNDFEVGEEVLLTGGGGAYEEPADEDQDDDERQLSGTGGGRDDVDDDDDDEAHDEDDNEEVGEEEDEEKARRVSKKRSKLTELKEKKRAKVEQMTVAAGGALRKGLTAEEQFQLFMLHQTAGSGGLVAALAQSRFVDLSPAPDVKHTAASPFARAIEVCVGKSKLNKSTDEMGCPVVLILCAGAKRATTVINGLSKKIHCKISKLFAKHIKIPEQVEALAKHHYPIAVGTPNRVEKLLELGALCLRNVDLVIVDVDEDAKHYSILNLPGVAEDFYKLVGNWVSKETEKEASTIKVTLLS